MKKLLMSDLRQRFPVPSEKVEEFCRRHKIRRLSLFGSVLRDDFGPDSDVDVLVDYEAGAQVSLFDLVRQEKELSALVGRKVDLRTPEELSRFFRNDVIREAALQYVAA